MLSEVNTKVRVLVMQRSPAYKPLIVSTNKKGYRRIGKKQGPTTYKKENYHPFGTIFAN